MQDCKLRPHHGMCISFFKGKGYDSAFTENMTRVINVFRNEDPKITLTVSEDIICGKCPHNKNHSCDSCDKVREYDNGVLTVCKLHDGDILCFSEFEELVRREILSSGRRSEICGDCCWNSICN